MPVTDRQKRYIVKNQKNDLVQWFPGENPQIEPLTDCNILPNIPYSLKKHKRWELMQELVRYMRENPADPNNLLVAAKVDPYNCDNSIFLAVSDIGIYGRRTYQPHTNTKSVIKQKMNQISKLNLLPSEVLEKDNGCKHPRRRRHPQHRDHHRPGERSKSIEVDTDSASFQCDESNVKAKINSVIIEPEYLTKKRSYYFYYRRWRLPEIVKANRQSLKTYTQEVNLRNFEDWIHETDPSFESEDELSDPTEGELCEVQLQNTLNESSSNNLFFDTSNKLITSAFVISMESFGTDSNSQSCNERVQCCYEDGDSVITKQSTICTPQSFAIDLTDLIVGRIRNQLTETFKSDPTVEDSINYANVAYLVVREQPMEKANRDSSNLHNYAVQLQVVLTPEGQLLTTSEQQHKPKEHTDDRMNLDELIQEAVNALSRLPIHCFNWDLCLPYERYELEDPQTGRAIRSDLNDDSSCVNSTAEEDTLESSFVFVEDQELKQQTLGCSLCAKTEMEEPIQLCANNHHACSECLRSLLKEKIQSICCGLTPDEVCWECPLNQCPVPLLRLAQLQTIPLHQLVPVWKCANFLEFHKHRTAENTPECTVYYANPSCAPGAVLAIKTNNSTSLRPSRPIDVTFYPGESPVRVFPRLYFESSTNELAHSPASCQTVRMFRKLYELLDDSQCMSPLAQPGPGGIYPAQLPAPDDLRSDSYCNALSAAWRRNCTDKWACSECPSSWRFVWLDELNGKEISTETITKWLRTLNEIQSFVQYSFVLAHFQPDQIEYLEMSNELMQKELYLGEALKLYPLQNMAEDGTSLPIRKSISRTLVEQMVTNAHHLNRRFFS